MNCFITDVLGLNWAFPTTIWGIVLYILVVYCFVEEGMKLLLIKKGFDSGISLGLGFGLAETIIRHPEVGVVPMRRAPAILVHIITAVIIAYFVRKRRLILGFLLAVLVHLIFNLLIQFAIKTPI